MTFAGDPSAYFGQCIIEEVDARLLRVLRTLGLEGGVPDSFDISDDENSFLPQLKVGILGAGIGGLYTALILDSLDIEYEILEASDRAGGRLSTYKFPNSGKYDYYEEGAMRFPLPKKDENGKYKNGTMKRLAELIEYGPLNVEGADRLKDKLIPYYFDAHDASNPGFYYFNGIHQRVEKGIPKGSFNAKDMGVGAAYVAAGSDAIHKDVILPFTKILIKDMQTGSKDGWAVMKQNDSYSVRGYMATKYLPSEPLNLPPQHLSNDVINWSNLLQSTSGGYDRALTEEVLSALSFAQVGDNNYGDVDWRCFEGGTETLPKKIEDYLKSKGSVVKFNRRVTSISKSTMRVCIPIDYSKERIPSSVKESPASEDAEVDISKKNTAKKTLIVPSVAVKVNGRHQLYSHVISTLPLTVLRTIDLENAGLNVMQRNALRALDYGPAIKIAILFKSNWWTTKLGIVGGQSYTDLPIRTIVYPSYGVDSGTPSKVLIASYTRTTDASRLGALSAKEEKEVLKELVLRNLAKAHYGVNGSTDVDYKFLVGEYKDMHVKDWNIDQYAMGAFANFSPGEFENLYSSLSVPAADRRLHFAGDAVSTRHGWVVGALDSAWKAVYEYLKVTRQKDKIKKFKEIWGGNAEWTANSTVVKGVENDLIDEHVALTFLAVLAGII